jgi:hypothetical protein
MRLFVAAIIVACLVQTPVMDGAVFKSRRKQLAAGQESSKIPVAASPVTSGSTSEVTSLYADIGNKLAEVKKMAPATAGRIGAVLDNVDRMYQLSKNSLSQDGATMLALEERTLESTVLQNELLKSKQESELLKQALVEAQAKIDELTKQVEKGNMTVQVLKEQHAAVLTHKKEAVSQAADPITAELTRQLLDKPVAQGGKQGIAPQNLNLTSTSDPSSPR